MIAHLYDLKQYSMENSKEQIIIYADKLTNILRKENIKWITGMKKKYRFACVMIPVGYPKEDPKT